MSNEEQEKREEMEKYAILTSTAADVVALTSMRRNVSAEINEKKEELIALMGELGITDHHYDIEEDGEPKLIELLLSRNPKVKLNKGTLAETLDVERSELDQRGMVELSEAGTLTTEIYQEHLEREVQTKIAIKKKKKPKKKKKV